ncbi:MAG: exosortase/archaeosortase family protein [Candidatus Hydrogenedentota bacterium]
MTQYTQTLTNHIPGVKDLDYRLLILLGAVIALLTALYWNAFQRMHYGWSTTESYYTHGYLVPFITLFFLWRQRHQFMAAPLQPAARGHVLIAGAILIMLVGNYLNFMIFGMLSFIPMVFGLSLALFGMERTKAIWFPLAFLLFMIPMPESVTQSFALQLKLMATKLAVLTANGLTLPMVQDGSFIYFGDDQLLVGEVCGGLRSLIALLAFGAIMAYISKTRPWAQVFLLIMSAPIAIVSNVFRIFLLCVVGYFWGSETAAGTFHDVSGVLIFVVAFILFFGLESLLRRLAPDTTESGDTPENGPQPPDKERA